MTTSTPPDNTVLVLSPPIVNGRTTPVVGAHIGLPLVAYDLVTDGEGAVVLVDPPLAGTMDPKDIMELWLESEPAALASETIENPDVRTTLRIPKGRLHPDRINKLYYTITRGSNNVGTSEPSLEILYNRIRPGLKDKLTDPGGHSELKLILPDTIKNGVGPGFASAEICVAYPYCRAYDLITLKCNGELLEPKPRVTPNQAPTPPNPGSEVPITICFTITRDFLDKAKRLDKKLNFLFTVTDQLGNGPDTDAPWSPVQSVDEDLDGVLLPMPILLERLEDFPGDDASIIDLEKLAGNPLSVVVLTADNRFVAGDGVLATYTAKNTGQPTDVVVTVPGKVEADPFGSKKTLFLEVPYDKVFAGSSVTVTYELRRPNSDLVGSSNTAKATVTDTAPIDLKPEITSVTDSLNKEIPHNGGTVDPQAKLTGTATPRQRVEIFEENSSNGKWPVNADGEWTYETTLAGIGTRVFTAKADYGTGQVSAERIFTLSNALTPAIDSVKDSAGVEIPNNGFTSDTTIKLSGTATPRLEVEIFDGAVSIGKAQVIGSTGEWEFEVTGLPPTAHSFKAKALYGTGSESLMWKITVRPALLSENFDNQPHQKIVAGQSITTPSMTITYLSGTGKIGIFNEVNGHPTVPGRREGNFLNTGASRELTGSQHIRLDFKSSYRTIRFWHSYANTLITVNIYRSDNSLIDTKHINGDNSFTPLLFEFKSEGIARVDLIHAWDWYALDFFSFEV